MTPRDVIETSLRLIGVLASGETASDSEANDAFNSMNRMIKNWSIEGFLVFKVVRESFALVINQQSYTMGTGGSFNTSRPTQILYAGTVQNDVELPVAIYNPQLWSQITLKSTQSTIPEVIYPEGTYPLETINVWPIPSGASDLILYSLKELSQFTSLSEEISLPPGYEDAITYNLAKRLAPEYGKPLRNDVAMEAAELKTNLKRKNTRASYMRSDAFGLNEFRKPFNYLTGDF